MVRSAYLSVLISLGPYNLVGKSVCMWAHKTEHAEPAFHPIIC